MFAWTPEITERVVDMWTRGLSAGVIAERIGVSRNAVIGKLHRLGHKRGYVPPNDGLSHVERRKLRRQAAREAQPFRPKKSKPLPQAPVLLTGQEKVWTCREPGECSWIVAGEGAESVACCQPVHKRNWCRFHFTLGTQPNTVMTPKDRRYLERRAA